MESRRSSAQTFVYVPFVINPFLKTASSNIVETFVYIPCVEESEMRIDLLVQKTNVHNFLRIPQSTFPTVSCTVQKC